MFFRHGMFFLSLGCAGSNFSGSLSVSICPLFEVSIFRKVIVSGDAVEFSRVYYKQVITAAVECEHMRTSDSRCIVRTYMPFIQTYTNDIHWH